MNSKKRVVLNYSSLSDELKGMIKRIYPDGFMKQLVSIPKANGDSYKAFTMDTGDILYLIKVDETYLKTPDEIINQAEVYKPGEEELDF